MPRIAAASVAEHVAQQERAVFDAAIGLFVERGYAGVSLADIASEVGLKRTSLYRYYPDKAHILLAWYHAEMPRQVAESERLLGGGGPPEARLHRWVEAQMDYARTPEHDLVVAFADISDQLSPDDLTELRDSHRALTAPLAGVLGELGVAPLAQPAVETVLGGLVLAASRAESVAGHPDGELRRRLQAAIAALVAG